MRERLRKLAERVESEGITPQVAHAVAALTNVQIRSIELSHKLEVSEALEARLAALEAAVAEEGGHFA
jgi:hypothetical protein